MLRRVLPTHDQTAGTTQLCRERSDFRWLKADQSKLIQPLAESLRERELGQRAGSDASLGVFVRHWVCRSDQAACLKASCSVEDGLGDRARCPAQRSLGLLRRNGSPFPQSRPRTIGSNSAAIRATKSGTGINGTFLAWSPSPCLSILATSDIQ